MINWKFYFGRRRVSDFRQWAVAHDVQDYAGLSGAMASLGLSCPTVEEAIGTFLPLAPVPTVIALPGLELPPPVEEPVPEQPETLTPLQAKLKVARIKRAKDDSTGV